VEAYEEGKEDETAKRHEGKKRRGKRRVTNNKFCKSHRY
jgi:hypothetical protein